ncbi:MAG: hypothetical protein J5819_05040 [Eubacterium sp.]|nr:hypothetical protein [Eubacterium sp.]
MSFFSSLSLGHIMDAGSILGGVGDMGASLTEWGVFGGNEEEKNKGAGIWDAVGGFSDVVSGAGELIEASGENSQSGQIAGFSELISGAISGIGGVARANETLDEEQADAVKGVAGGFGAISGISGLVNTIKHKDKRSDAENWGRGLKSSGNLVKGIGNIVGAFGASDENAKLAGQIISFIGSAAGSIGGVVNAFARGHKNNEKKNNQLRVADNAENDDAEDFDISAHMPTSSKKPPEPSVKLPPPAPKPMDDSKPVPVPVPSAKPTGARLEELVQIPNIVDKQGK